MNETATQVRPRVQLKIRRYNPTESRPWFDDFSVTVNPATTILDALVHIKETIDPTITFRASCRSSICGSCAMSVNGASVLACRTRVLDIGSDLVLLPLGNLPVLRDLVADVEPFFQTLDAVYPYLEPSLARLMSETTELIGPEQLADIDKAADCIMCGCCHSACTAREFNEQFLGPAAFTKNFRFIADTRDTKLEKRMLALRDGRIWSCDRCMNCTEVCPRSIDPEMKIEKLKNRMSGKDALPGFGSESGVRKVESFTKMVKKRGRVSELRLPISIHGVAAIGLYDIALKIFIKRRLSGFLTGSALKQKEIRELTRGKGPK